MIKKVPSQHDGVKRMVGWQKDCLPTGQQKDVAYEKVVRKKCLCSALWTFHRCSGNSYRHNIPMVSHSAILSTQTFRFSRINTVEHFDITPSLIRGCDLI